MQQRSEKPTASGSPGFHAHSGDVRVLFLHAAMDGLSAEYKVHKALAESATSYGVESFFLWQKAARATGDNTMSFPWPERVRFLDFGRDFSASAPVARMERAHRMLRRLPDVLRSAITQVRAIQPDLLYTSQQIHDVRLARVLSWLTGVPHVIHLHYMVGPWLSRDILWVIRRSPRLVAVSEFIRQSAMLQGVDPVVVNTVPNSIGPDAFQYVGDRVALRAEFGWEPDAPVLISVGRLDPMKGHLELIDIFDSVRRQMPRARLLICGHMHSRSNYPEQLRRRVAELGLQEVVAFAGHRYDISELMCGADAFALLSEMEPFGLVFLEAMAAGLPVAAFRSGAIPEIVVDEVTGLLAYPQQREAMVRNLVRLLSDRSLAAHMGEAGRARAASIFSPEAITPAWVALMHRFAGKAAQIPELSPAR